MSYISNNFPSWYSLQFFSTQMHIQNHFFRLQILRGFCPACTSTLESWLKHSMASSFLTVLSAKKVHILHQAQQNFSNLS